MKKLWVFGCSVSDLYNTETSKYYWSGEYLKWKGYVPKHYTEILADRLGYNLSNCAVSSTCNHQIFQDFCESYNQIDENDFIIIQWTEPNRFRLVNDDNEWTTFVPHRSWVTHNLKKITHFTLNSINEIFVNRLKNPYRKEIDSWSKLITSIIGEERILIWYPFDNIITNGRIVKSIETIKDETKGKIEDLHFSENGQIELSNILLKIINKEKKEFI